MHFGPSNASIANSSALIQLQSSTHEHHAGEFSERDAVIKELRKQGYKDDIGNETHNAPDHRAKHFVKVTSYGQSGSMRNVHGVMVHPNGTWEHSANLSHSGGGLECLKAHKTIMNAAASKGDGHLSLKRLIRTIEANAFAKQKSKDKLSHINTIVPSKVVKEKMQPVGHKGNDHKVNSNIVNKSKDRDSHIKTIIPSKIVKQMGMPLKGDDDTDDVANKSGIQNELSQKATKKSKHIKTIIPSEIIKQMAQPVHGDKASKKSSNSRWKNADAGTSTVKGKDHKINAGGPGSGRHAEFGKFKSVPLTKAEEKADKISAKWRSPKGTEVHSMMVQENSKGHYVSRNKENGKTVFSHTSPTDETGFAADEHLENVMV